MNAVAMVTRVDRVDVSAVLRGEISPQDAMARGVGDTYERRMTLLGRKYPMPRQEDVSWYAPETPQKEPQRAATADLSATTQKDGGYFSRMGKILGLVKGASPTVEIANDKTLEKDKIMPALKGVKVACQAVDEIFSGRSTHVICATKRPQEAGASSVDAGYDIFGSGVMAGYYALSKEGVSRIVVVDFGTTRDAGLREMVAGIPGMLLVSVAVGRAALGQKDLKIADNIKDVGLPSKATEDDLSRLFEKMISHSVRDFHPDLLILSLRPDEVSFGEYVSRIMAELAAQYANNRYVCILEGVENEAVVAKFRGDQA